MINAAAIWEDGMNSHDIEKLFKAHEIIHDYDYWVLNTPPALDYPAADWAGVKVYFGKVSIIK